MQPFTVNLNKTFKNRINRRPSHSKNTWKQFERDVRLRGHELLKRLDDFSDSVLVTGCQRSGTTMLSRMITKSEGMVNYWFGRDDELDAALILAGCVTIPPQNGRYCFQTTYLNANYQEYFNHKEGHKIIWVLRNPFSVVYSMTHNWRPAALGRLFDSCGAQFLEGAELRRYENFGLFGIGRLRQACLSHKGKLAQLFELRSQIGPDRMMIVSYDELTADKDAVLPEIYRFINLDYKKRYGEFIHTKSVGKIKRQSKREAAYVEQLCLPVYLEAMQLIEKEAKA
ncbi:MAG: sulfotransferase [Desulfobacteraceae bacterium]|nr:sulfotransferase [Desulfobacteraceae bacterium]